MKNVIRLSELNSLDKPYLLLSGWDCRPKEGVLINELQNPDTIRVAEIKSLIGEDITFNLSKVGNNIYKMVSPSRLNLKEVASRLCFCIDLLKNSGKSENAINNAYFRFLSWMHFEFREILRGSVTEDIKYQGGFNIYSLMMLYIIAGIGKSVVIVSNSEVDDSIFSQLNVYNLSSLDKPNSLKNLGISANRVANKVSVLPSRKLDIGTNFWLKGENLDEILISEDKRECSNMTKSAFIRVLGVADRTTYLQELFDLYSKVKDNAVIINSDFKPLMPNDITRLRGRYKSDDLVKYILDLCTSLGVDEESYSILVNEIYDIVDKVPKNKEQVLLTIFFNIRNVLNGTSSRGRSYLFFLETKPLTQVQIDSLYLLSCMKFDVVIFNPSLVEDTLEIPRVYNMTFTEKLDLERFPTSSQDLVVETTAFNAENELTDLLYDGSAGIFRDNQFSNARSVLLKPMNEEIDILWDYELSVRQGFGVSGGIVTMPVIFAELSGVKDGDIIKWNQRFASLFKGVDVVYNQEQSFNLSWDLIHSAEVFRNKRVDADLLIQHKNYPYSYLSKSVQLYLIEKLQELFDSGVVKGVYTNGVENEILNVFVGISQNDKLVRYIQNFDFTKVNPKILYVWMRKEKIPRRDIILLHYLNLVGFDILVFVPTGYSVMDEFITKKVYTEYRNGIGVEPFQVKAEKQNFFNKLFRRC